jgi:hypothetical protein
MSTRANPPRSTAIFELKGQPERAHHHHNQTLINNLCRAFSEQQKQIRKRSVAHRSLLSIPRNIQL